MVSFHRTKKENKKMNEWKSLEVWTATIVLLVITIGTLTWVTNTTPSLMDSITGLVPTTANITQQSQSEMCDFYLQQGWNLVSFHCLSNYPDTTVALAPIEGNYRSVFSYNPTTANDSWSVYNPSLPSYVVQDLATMDRVHGYWIYMGAGQQYTLTGAYVKRDIDLVPGWNLVGYPSKTSDTADNAFASIAGQLTKAYIYNATTDLLQPYYPGDPNASTFNATYPFIGIWINATATTTWVLP